MRKETDPAGSERIVTQGSRADLEALVSYGGDAINGDCEFVEGHMVLSPSTRDRFFHRGDIYWEENANGHAYRVSDEVQVQGNVTEILLAQKRQEEERSLRTAVQQEEMKADFHRQYNSMQQALHHIAIGYNEPPGTLTALQSLWELVHSKNRLIRAEARLCLTIIKHGRLEARLKHARDAVDDLTTLRPFAVDFRDEIFSDRFYANTLQRAKMTVRQLEAELLAG